MRLHGVSARIQQRQNKDSIALHLKLNELLAASTHASNRMIGIEELDERDPGFAQRSVTLPCKAFTTPAPMAAPKRFASRSATFSFGV